MKLKLYQVINPLTIQALDVLGTEIVVPKNFLWTLAKTIRKVNTELEVYNEARKAVFTKYGIRNGESLEIPKDKIEAANIDLQEILNADVELPLTAPIPIPVELPDTSRLTAQYISILIDTQIICEKQ